MKSPKYLGRTDSPKYTEWLLSYQSEWLRSFVASVGCDGGDATELRAAAQLHTGFHEFKLKIVSAYIRTERVRVSEYLPRLHALQQELQTAKKHETEPVYRLSLNAFEGMPAAADLLHLSAVLGVRIPLAVIESGAGLLGEPIGAVVGRPDHSEALRDVIQRLMSYELLEWSDEERTAIQLSLPLQIWVLGGMDGASKRQWAERAVRAVANALPEPIDPFAGEEDAAVVVEQDPFLSLSMACAGFLYKNEMNSLCLEDLDLEKDGSLWSRIGFYQDYRQAGCENDSEVLYKQALANCEAALGPDHPDVLDALELLAGLYFRRERYAEAEPLAHRAVSLCAKLFGLECLEFANSLNNQAWILARLGRWSEAGEAHAWAMGILERELGPADVAVTPLLDLSTGQWKRPHPPGPSEREVMDALFEAEASLGQGRLDEAASRYRRAIALCLRRFALRKTLTAMAFRKYKAALRQIGKSP